jgi:hypothetical protein
MAEKETPLGMEFMRWQNAPSLSGGAFDDLMQGVKRGLFAKGLQASGIQDYFNNLGAKPPSNLEKPELLPQGMSGDAGFNQQNVGGEGFKASGGEGFKMPVVPPQALSSSQPMGMANAAIPQPYVAPSIASPSAALPATPSGPASSYDEAMQRFGFKPFSIGG